MEGRILRSVDDPEEGCHEREVSGPVAGAEHERVVGPVGVVHAEVLPPLLRAVIDELRVAARA